MAGIEPRQLLIDSFQSAVNAVKPAFALPEYIPEPPKNGRLIVLAMGKAGEEMARVTLQTLEKHHGSSLARNRFEALAVVRRGDFSGEKHPLITVMEAGHPDPDQGSVDGAEALLKWAQTAEKNDHVLALISGGASALTLCPADGLMRRAYAAAQGATEAKRRDRAKEIALGWLQAANRAMIRAGLNIEEINIIRKHLSKFSGGRLPAHQTLIISDVPSDDPSAIGSGPTVPDASTFADALALVEKHRLRDYGFPEEAIDHLREAPADEETIKPRDPRASKPEDITIIASARHALDAAAAFSRAQGIETIIDGVLTGDVDEVSSSIGQRMLALAHERGLAAAVEAEIRRKARANTDHKMPLLQQAIVKPVLLLSGGELTVTIPADVTPGFGGRNTRFLGNILAITQGCPGLHGASLGTDGIDYKKYAGAVFTDQSYAHAIRQNLDIREFLARYDSHTFFEKLGNGLKDSWGGIIETGPTGTNVGDIRGILLMP